jgi:hypothetical protein
VTDSDEQERSARRSLVKMTIETDEKTALVWLKKLFFIRLPNRSLDSAALRSGFPKKKSYFVHFFYKIVRLLLNIPAEFGIIKTTIKN